VAIVCGTDGTLWLNVTLNTLPVLLPGPQPLASHVMCVSTEVEVAVTRHREADQQPYITRTRYIPSSTRSLRS
jgi:hypothetical protein